MCVLALWPSLISLTNGLHCLLFKIWLDLPNLYWQRGCANSGLWILIGTAALRIVVGVFLIRTAVKIVTCCDVFFAAVQSSRILIAINLQFGHIAVFLHPELCHPLSLVHSFLPVSIFAVFTPPCEWCGLWVWCFPSVLVISQSFKVSGSEWSGVQGAGEICFGGGRGGIYVCVTEKEREGQHERKGVQCMCECVCMQLDEKWSVDWMTVKCYYVARVGRKDTT